jgi:hypothetical protein
VQIREEWNGTRNSRNERIGRRKVAHKASGVTRMKDPADAFGEAVARVDDTLDVFQNNMASPFPVLNGKILNVNMAGAFSGTTGVDHLDCRFVVLIERSGAGLEKTELCEDGAEVFGHFGSGNGGNKLGFSRASGSDSLRFAAIGDDTTGK